MKNVINLPVIGPKHYDAFRNVMKDNLPDTYDEWEKLHFEQVTDCLRQGLPYNEVPITPDEFSAYCRANGHSPKAIILRRFAREKVVRKS